LLLAVLLEVIRKGKPEDEGEQDGVALRGVGEHHEDEERDEDDLDLRLNDAVAVAPEEPGRDLRQHDDDRDRGDEESGNQAFGLMKIAERASAVPTSVTKVALMISLPIRVALRPRSTSTA
jgi:hypothetical protein